MLSRRQYAAGLAIPLYMAVQLPTVRSSPSSGALCQKRFSSCRQNNGQNREIARVMRCTEVTGVTAMIDAAPSGEHGVPDLGEGGHCHVGMAGAAGDDFFLAGVKVPGVTLVVEVITPFVFTVVGERHGA